MYHHISVVTSMPQLTGQHAGVDAECTTYSSVCCTTQQSSHQLFYFWGDLWHIFPIAAFSPYLHNVKSTPLLNNFGGICLDWGDSPYPPPPLARALLYYVCLWRSRAPMWWILCFIKWNDYFYYLLEAYLHRTTSTLLYPSQTSCPK